MKFSFLPTILLGVFIITSCSNDKQSSETFCKDELSKFSQLIIKEQKIITKYLQTKDTTDTVIIKNIDSLTIANELSLFAKNDVSLNKLSQYKIDTLFQDNFTQIEISALDEKPSTRKVQKKIYNDGSFVLIIDVDKTSRIYTMKYHLELNSKTGYLIEAKQKVKASFDEEFRIEGKL